MLNTTTTNNNMLTSFSASSIRMIIEAFSLQEKKLANKALANLY